MAYSGYRIKIGTYEVSNTIMVRGSYSMQRTRRVLDSYYDAAGTLHEEISPVTKAEISFKIREHSMAEHTALMTAFSTRTITAQYYDDTAGDYANGTFRVEDMSNAHSYAVGNTIRYGEIEIKMKEN